MRVAIAVLVSLAGLAFGGGAAQAQAFTLDPDTKQTCSSRQTDPAAQHIKELITDISRIEGKGGYYPFSEVYPVLEQLRRLVNSWENIEAFRCYDDLSVIRKLVAFARTEERVVRINASLLLANVVDNTTLCGVLEELFDRNVEVDTRYNFWQIVLVVASYARPENREWIQAAMNDNMGFVAQDQNYENTRRVIDQVKDALLKRRQNVPLKDTYPDEYRACIALPNISSLVTEPPPQ